MKHYLSKVWGYFTPSKPPSWNADILKYIFNLSEPSSPFCVDLKQQIQPKCCFSMLMFNKLL